MTSFASAAAGLTLMLAAAPLLAWAPLGGAQPTANQAPHLSELTARIGTVHLEGGGTKRGVKGTYRLCDDGPQTSPRRFGLVSITHRSSSALLVRERSPSISWDTYFARPECRGRIFWSSATPADLPSIRSSPCYSVSLRVRDPGGKWSNLVTRVVTACGKRGSR